MEQDWFKAGYYVRYWNPVANKYEFYWLRAEEVLPSYVFKFPSVPAGSDSGYRAVGDLKPAKGHLFQMRMGIQTACHIYVQVPGGTSLGGTDERMTETADFRAVGFYTQDMSPFWNPDPITNMFFAYWDTQYYPWLKAYNPTDKPITPRVRFVGKMFETELVTDRDLLDRLEKRVIPWSPVSIGILPGKGRR